MDDNGIFIEQINKIGDAPYLGNPQTVMDLLRDLAVDSIERWSTDDGFSDEEKDQRLAEDEKQIGELVEAFLGKDAEDFQPVPSWNAPGMIDRWIVSAVPKIEDQSPEDVVETAVRLFLHDVWSVVETWKLPGADEADCQNALTLVLTQWTDVFMGIDSEALEEEAGDVVDPNDLSNEELLSDFPLPEEEPRKKSLRSTVIKDEHRGAFLDSVVNAPARVLKPKRSAVSAFRKHGDVERFVSDLNKTGDNDSMIAALRASSKFAEDHGGLDVVKNPELRSLHEKSSAVIGSLGEDDKNRIAAYTLSQYGPINDALRKHQKLSNEQRGVVDSVSRAVDGVGSWDKPATVYRGISTQDDQEHESLLSALQRHADDGSEWVDHGIASASASGDFARDWLHDSPRGGVLLRINSKTGILASSLSNLPHQQEVIKKPGTRYRVRGISHEDNRFGGKLPVVDLDEV